MSNPNPAHNPTDGLNSACYVQITGTNVTNPSGGAGSAQGTIGVPLGQGIGAAPSTNHPVAQYALTLSLTSATVNGVAYHPTCQLTTVLKDVANTTYSTSNSANIKYKSYNDPAAGAPVWYHPSEFAGYAADVASISAAGLVTALAKGEAVVEVSFPFADDVMTPQNDATTGNPTMAIFVQVLVHVIA